MVSNTFSFGRKRNPSYRSTFNAQVQPPAKGTYFGANPNPN